LKVLSLVSENNPMKMKNIKRRSCSYLTRNILDFYGVGKTNDTPICPCMMQGNARENFHLGSTLRKSLLVCMSSGA